jgi:hypothetical protein
MKTRWDAGQFKLKGKKHMHLSCGCCTISNFKQEHLVKEVNAELLTAYISYKAEQAIQKEYDTSNSPNATNTIKT